MAHSDNDCDCDLSRCPADKMITQPRQKALSEISVRRSLLTAKQQKVGPVNFKAPSGVNVRLQPPINLDNLCVCKRATASFNQFAAAISIEWWLATGKATAKDTQPLLVAPHCHPDIYFGAVCRAAGNR